MDHAVVLGCRVENHRWGCIYRAMTRAGRPWQCLSRWSREGWIASLAIRSPCVPACFVFAGHSQRPNSNRGRYAVVSLAMRKRGRLVVLVAIGLHAAVTKLGACPRTVVLAAMPSRTWGYVVGRRRTLYCELSARLRKIVPFLAAPVEVRQSCCRFALGLQWNGNPSHGTAALLCG